MSPTPPNQPPPGWGPDPQQGGWVPPDQQGGWVPPAQQPPPAQPGWQDPNAGWNSAPGYGTPPPGLGGPPVRKKSSPVVPIVVLVVVLIAAAVGAFLVLSGGDDDESGPAAALESYVTAANDRDCAAMVDVIDIEEAGGTRQDLLAQCQDAFETADEGSVDISEFIPEGVESTETVSEGDDRATLAVQFRMSDGGTEPDEVDFTRIDGDWKIVSSSLSLGDVDTPPDTAPTTGPPQPTSTTPPDTTSPPATTDDSLPFSLGGGTPEQLDPLREACASGDMGACDDLWYGAPSGSEYEDFAETCGGLDPAGGHVQTCEDEYG